MSAYRSAQTHIPLFVLCFVTWYGSSAAAQSDLKGKIIIDGSSTVHPIAVAAAEMFRQQHPKVDIAIGVSGTGGGFKKFLDTKPELRTTINCASRPIKPAEITQASQLQVEFIEIPIAMDGLAIVVNKSNTFCTSLTLEELKKIWEPGSQIRNWNQVRPGFPDLKLSLFGAGTDSGTFDYFTEVVVGKERSSRNDYAPSENDSILVKGVEGDKGALGYFGFSYYEGNKDQLNLVAIDNGDGKPVIPSMETVRSGKYHPLSRPLFFYVNKEHLARPAVSAFLEFSIRNMEKIVTNKHVNYVPLQASDYEAVMKHFKAGTVGSRMTQHKSGTPLNFPELYKPGP